MTPQVYNYPSTDHRVTEKASELIALLQEAIPPGPQQSILITASAMMAVRNSAIHLPDSGDPLRDQVILISSITCSLIFGLAETLRDAFVKAGHPAPNIALLRHQLLSDVTTNIGCDLRADIRSTTPAPVTTPKKEAS